MAPEMHAGREYSYAADVWSLGCLLYELCALEPLFQDREEEVVARKVRGRGRGAGMDLRAMFAGACRGLHVVHNAQHCCPECATASLCCCTDA